MPLPDLIEIVPPSEPVAAEVTVPGSKSITNRALILAALSSDRTELSGALWSEDTQVMVDALIQLGFSVAVTPDPSEPSNRRIVVEGRSGVIPRAGTAAQPLELFVGNAGTAARFLLAFVCLGRGVCRLTGTPRMHARPQAALIKALRQLGYRIESANGHLPAVVFGAGPRPGRCLVSVEQSSQFASALLLSAAAGGWEVELEGRETEEGAYVELTRQMLKVFPRRGGSFPIEPDASSGSYFWAAGWLFKESTRTSTDPHRPEALSTWPVRVRAWPHSRWQIDARFPELLPLPRQLSRASDLGDSILTAMVLAAALPCPAANAGPNPGYLFTDLGRLRLQECERVQAIRTELTKCGAQVHEQGDTLRIVPSLLHGATIDTYQDHRLAMCFAILGLKVSGLRLKNPVCVNKTFPDFFVKLAAPPPDGLGIVVKHGATGESLPLANLRASQ